MVNLHSHLISILSAAHLFWNGLLPYPPPDFAAPTLLYLCIMYLCICVYVVCFEMACYHIST